MIKQWLIRCGVLSMTMCMLLCTCLGFVGCKKKLIDVSYNLATQTYVNQKTGVTYTEMPMSFAVEKLKDEYAVIHMGANEYVLYEIEGLDPLKWLATSDGLILRAASEPDVAFEALTITRIQVCALANTTVVIQDFSDKSVIRTIFDEAKSERYFSLPPIPAEEKFLVRFSSEEYPGLFYTMRYMIYGEDLEVCYEGSEELSNAGKFVLYDLARKRCMAVGELEQKKGQMSESDDYGSVT